MEHTDPKTPDGKPVPHPIEPSERNSLGHFVEGHKPAPLNFKKPYKKRELMERVLAEEFTEDAVRNVFRQLVQDAQSKHPQLRQTARTELLNRAYGKPIAPKTDVSSEEVGLLGNLPPAFFEFVDAKKLEFEKEEPKQLPEEGAK